MRDVVRPDAEEPDAVEEDTGRTKSSSLLADVARGQDVVDLCVRRVWARGGDGGVCVCVCAVVNRAIYARPRERA